MRRFGAARLRFPSPREIHATRRYDAPAALVFAAWTEAPRVQRWWVDARHPLVDCAVDLRVGGSWRLAAAAEDGPLVWRGEYRELRPPTRLVTTQRIDHLDDNEALLTVTLDERRGVTTLDAHFLHWDRRRRDGHLQAGMVGSLRAALERLEVYLLAEAERAATTLGA